VHASPLLVHCADAADEAFCRDAQSCFKQLSEKMSGVYREKRFMNTLANGPKAVFQERRITTTL
jgi:hypothetical protein